MVKKEKTKEEAVFIFCRDCGLEYIESKDWLFQYPAETKCPNCGNILRLF